MLPEFSFPTVMYGIEILLCAFVCALTLMIFRPILLFADFGDITFRRLVGFCPQGAGPVQRQSSYGCPCAAARSVFGNGMGGDCSLPATSWVCSHRRGSPGTRRWPPPPRPSVRACLSRLCSCFRLLLATAIPRRTRPSCYRSARF